MAMAELGFVSGRGQVGGRGLTAVSGCEMGVGWELDGDCC